MPITSDRVAKLREFGLSEYGARAYLALLDLGLTEARDISNLSKVPQAKIYQILEQLHEKGLVVILPEFPKKYAPVPFEEFVDRLLQEHESAARALARDRARLTEIFTVTGHMEAGDRGDFNILRGRRNVVETLAKLVGQSQRDVLVLGTAGMLRWGETLAEPLRAAVKRGVRVRMLLPVTRETLAQVRPFDALVEVRDRALDDNAQSRRVAIVVADGKHAFLVNFVPDDGDLYAGKDLAVSTDQEAMVAAIEAIVEPLWRSAHAFSARREVLEEGRLPEFTRLYATAEESREAIAAALEAGYSTLRVAAPEAAAHDLWAPVILDRKEADGEIRLLTDVPDARAHDDLRRRLGEGDACEIRHTDAAPAQVLLVDDREAFLVFGRSRAQAGDLLVVHTSVRGVVESLRRQFEQTWRAALPLDVRAREWARYPLVHPRDVGLGLLFETTREAVLVADAAGQVVLCNAAAERLLQRPARDLLATPLEDVLPGLDVRGPEVGHLRCERGHWQRERPALPIRLEARRADGGGVPVEATLDRVAILGGGAFLVVAARGVASGLTT